MFWLVKFCKFLVGSWSFQPPISRGKKLWKNNLGLVWMLFTSIHVYWCGSGWNLVQVSLQSTSTHVDWCESDYIQTRPYWWSILPAPGVGDSAPESSTWPTSSSARGCVPSSHHRRGGSPAPTSASRPWLGFKDFLTALHFVFIFKQRVTRGLTLFFN